MMMMRIRGRDAKGELMFSNNLKIPFFVFLKYNLHTWQTLNEDTSSKSDMSSLKYMRGLQTKKRGNYMVQNRSIKNMGCKIAQLTKYRGKKCN
jgi:hypothetical protein